MARFNAKEYLLNTKTGVLHLNGYCHHVKNLNGIMQFDTEEEAYAFDKNGIRMCKTCLNNKK